MRDTVHYDLDPVHIAGNKCGRSVKALEIGEQGIDLIDAVGCLTMLKIISIANILKTMLHHRVTQRTATLCVSKNLIKINRMSHGVILILKSIMLHIILTFGINIAAGSLTNQIIKYVLLILGHRINDILNSLLVRSGIICHIFFLFISFVSMSNTDISFIIRRIERILRIILIIRMINYGITVKIKANLSILGLFILIGMNHYRINICPGISPSKN